MEPYLRKMEQDMTKQTYRTVLALWALLCAAIAAAIGIYVFESLWAAGLGAAGVSALIWGILNGFIKPIQLYGNCFDHFDIDINNRYN